MFCTNCGAQQKDDAKFCTVCGAKLMRDTESVPQDTPPVVSAQEGISQYHSETGAERTVVHKGHRITLDPAVIVLALALTAAVGAGVAIATNGFGLMGPSSQEQVPQSEESKGVLGALPDEADDVVDETEEGDALAPEVRAAVDDYSWEELSDISRLISSAGSDEDALLVARQYNLCNDDGTLDGTQVKYITLGGDLTVAMQVAGFNHDERADGSGMAGITFISNNAIGLRPMNSSGSTAGGWRDSELRSWMNSDLPGFLPEDAASAIVPVVKYTNAVGETTDPSSVVATVDTLWIPSYSEMGGYMDIADDEHDDVYNAEGAQYQLFSDLGVRWDTPNEILAFGGIEFWWERTPDPMDGRFFMCVGGDGTPWYARTPDNSFGVALCFCV